ncbi:hypothetical protein BV22DRAFT_1039971 [Leucogyrophana mollusca]|uniref:Uncharacterized protein n=1 Tax=Leucogyrophana mollusca TaxID=85980 RepID=A0ACB8B4K0_9AGAM|nr:hypothetical protein BV22DRAFT_1039971 [Leucogyrophana mollusca]
MGSAGHLAPLSAHHGASCGAGSIGAPADCQIVPGGLCSDKSAFRKWRYTQGHTLQCICMPHSQRVPALVNNQHPLVFFIQSFPSYNQRDPRHPGATAKARQKLSTASVTDIETATIRINQPYILETQRPTGLLWCS